MSRRFPRSSANSCLALFVCIIGVFALSLQPIVAQSDGFPIRAWSGPPANETNAERYRELADAGFTHNYSGFGNADAMEKALDVAQAAGIKQFISLPELQTNPEKIAERFKGHPAL